jgi:hypothetical protein
MPETLEHLDPTRRIGDNMRGGLRSLWLLARTELMNVCGGRPSRDDTPSAPNHLTGKS